MKRGKKQKSKSSLFYSVEFGSNDNAEVVFTKELIQTKEDCEVVGKFSLLEME